MSRPPPPRRDARATFTEHLGDAKVRDLHTALFVQEEIFGFDVAMDDAVLMRILQRLAHGRHHGQRLLGREPAGLHCLPQIHAVHEFHEQKVKAACLAKVVNRDNIWVVQRRERLRLLGESVCKPPVHHALRRQQLQRHKPFKRFLPRFIDDTHAPAAKAFHDVKLRKVRRQFLRHVGRCIGSAARPLLRGGGQPGEKALRTEPVGRPFRQRRAAIRAQRGLGRKGGIAGHTFY